MSIALVTDSTADIPSEIAGQHSIHVVPDIIVMDGRSIEDGKGLSRQEFYEKLPELRTLPTTAAPSAGTFQKLYETLFWQGMDQIISVHASSLLSGIYNAASIAAQSFTNRVYVVDSEQISLGMGFQVLAAAEAVMDGLQIEAVLDRIASVRRRVRLIAMLDTLEYVRRSGRVSWARARLGSLLQIKPFLDIRNGQVLSLGEVRTRKKGIARLIELALSLGPLDRLAILHTSAEAEAHHLLKSLEARAHLPTFIVQVTTIIGVHAGPKSLGFAAVTK
jgi:DegV family protein with EDD domain